MKNTRLKGGFSFTLGRASRPLELSTAKAKLLCPEESDIQATFFQCLKLNERRVPELRFFFHVPNGGLRDEITGAFLKKQGVKPGVLDCFLPIPRKGFYGLWIEFKTIRGDTSDEQKIWIAFLESQNYLVYVLTDWQEAVRLTSDYLDVSLSY